jgi:Flp pilus assembly pilin Flp
MENENLLDQMKRRNRKRKGVTVVEYALMLALVAIAVALAAPNIGSAVISVFSKASSIITK